MKLEFKARELRTRHRILLWSAASACAIAFVTPASAQNNTAADSGSSSGGVIVVTAQRREQVLTDVPISITAFNAEELEKGNVTEAKEYLAFAPNVTFTEDGETGNRSINIAIRGVANVDLGEVSTQQSIGYYLDEQSVGSTANGTYNPQMLDIERVEVLRGPQGTYFGRNASGGALNITTKKPTDVVEGEIGVDYGKFDSWRVYGVVNLPLSEGFAFRGVASYEESNGIVKNVNPNGAPNSGYEYVFFRGALRYQPSADLTWDVSVSYTDEDEGLDATVASGVLDLDTKSIFGDAFVPIDDQLGFYPDNQKRVNHNAPEYNRNKFLIANNRLSVLVSDDIELRSITGYIDSANARFFDQDNISADAINRINDYDGRSFSQELRLQSAGGSNVDWVVGGLYANDKIEQFNSIQAGTEGSYTDPVTGDVIGLLPPIPAGFRINENNRVFKTESYALFADVTYNAGPLHVTVGGRYSHDKITNTQFDTVAFEGAVPDISGSESFDDFSPRFVIRYDVGDSANVYATVSKGYKAGGVDINSGNVLSFDPETLWSYEIGLKGSTADNTIFYGISGFYLDWKDLQVQTNFLLDPNDISSAVERTLNAAGARSYGVEAELRARLTNQFSVQLAAGLLDAKFKSFPDAVLAGGNAVDLSDKRLPKTPDVTFSAVADYTAELNAVLDYYVRAEFNSRSSAPGDLEGVAANELGLPDYPYVPGGYAVVNLRAGLESDSFEVSAFVENLFGEDYYTGTQDNFGLGGIRLRPHPTTWGVGLKYKF